MSAITRILSAAAFAAGMAVQLPAAITVSMDMDPATPGIQGSRAVAAGQVVTADIVMAVGAEGVSSCGISVNFDNSELALNGAPAATELLPAGFTFNLNAGVNSESQASGHVRTFEAATLANGPVNTNFVIGSIRFTAAAPGTDGTADVTPGLFNTGVDGCFDNAGNAVGPVFVPGKVDLFVEQGPWVTITGTMTHSENFNTLPTVDVAWTDSGPLHGWYAQINDGASPAGTLQVSDGAVALSGLFNAGASDSSDRAAGSKATSTGNVANISWAILMRNTGTRAVKLSRLRYAGELWRSGSVANLQEKTTVFYAVSDAPLATIASGGSNATAAPGAGFSALPAGASTLISSATTNTALNGDDAANHSVVDLILTTGTEPVILAGQYFTVKWTDTNETAGTDGHQAIDDVALDFTELDCAITAAITNVLRKPGANLADPADDVVDFRLTVAGSGNIGPGWRSIAPAALVPNSGSYGTPKDFAGVPIAQFTPDLALTLADQATPSCQTTAVITLPLLLGEITLGGTSAYLQAAGAPAIFRQTATRELTMDPGSAELLTDAIAITPGVEKCLTLTVEVEDRSPGSGFETDDTFKVELLTFGPAGGIKSLTEDFDVDGNGVVNGGATPLADECNIQQQAVDVKWTSTFLLAGVIPAGATSFRVRISGAINGNAAATTTEVYRFKNAAVAACVDTDRDGTYDAWEAVHGTNPAQAASKFGIIDVATTATAFSVTIPGVTGRSYQALTSADLFTWSRDGLPIPGDDTPEVFTSPISPARTFRRILVQPLQVINP